MQHEGSRVIASTLIPELPKTEKSQAYWRKNVASFWGALDEDFALGVSAQSTLASGAQEALYFGDRMVLGQVPRGRGSGARVGSALRPPDRSRRRCPTHRSHR
jgi:hypothetical protein